MQLDIIKQNDTNIFFKFYILVLKLLKDFALSYNDSRYRYVLCSQCFADSFYGGIILSIKIF